MRNVFVCWRPLQVINAINFVANDIENSKLNSDIIIIDDFVQASLIASNIKALNLFENVYYIKKRSKINRFKEVYNIFNYTQYLVDTIGVGESYLRYDKVIASGWHPIAYSLALLNKKNEFILSEDGIGSYLGDTRIHEFNWKIKLLGRIFKVGPLAVRIKRAYISEPSIIDTRNTEYNIHQLKIDLSNQKLLKYLNHVFGTTEESDKRKRKIIILDQPIQVSIQNVDGNKLKREILNIVSSKFNLDDIYLRLHPNSEYYTLDSPNVLIQDSTVPWEVYCYHNITDNDILISFHSSGLITPKIFFDIEPTIMCLYKLLPFNNQEEIQEIELFYQKITKNYNDENKVLILNDINEL